MSRPCFERLGRPLRSRIGRRHRGGRASRARRDRGALRLPRSLLPLPPRSGAKHQRRGQRTRDNGPAPPPARRLARRKNAPGLPRPFAPHGTRGRRRRRPRRTRSGSAPGRRRSPSRRRDHSGFGKRQHGRTRVRAGRRPPGQGDHRRQGNDRRRCGCGRSSSHSTRRPGRRRKKRRGRPVGDTQLRTTRLPGRLSGTLRQTIVLGPQVLPLPPARSRDGPGHDARARLGPPGKLVSAKRAHQSLARGHLRGRHSARPRIENLPPRRRSPSADAAGQNHERKRNASAKGRRRSLLRDGSQIRLFTGRWHGPTREAVTSG